MLQFIFKVFKAYRKIGQPERCMVRLLDWSIFCQPVIILHDIIEIKSDFDDSEQEDLDDDEIDQQDDTANKTFINQNQVGKSDCDLMIKC